MCKVDAVKDRKISEDMFDLLSKQARDLIPSEITAQWQIEHCFRVFEATMEDAQESFRNGDVKTAVEHLMLLWHEIDKMVVVDCGRA